MTKRELLEKIRSVDVNYNDYDAFERMKDLCTKYANESGECGWETYFEGIFDEDEALERINSMYKLYDIQKYIQNTETSCELFREEFNELWGVYTTDIEDMQQDIINDLQSAIEEEEIEEKRKELLKVIQDFHKSIINGDTQSNVFTTEYEDKLTYYILKHFDIERKGGNENA